MTDEEQNKSGNNPDAIDSFRRRFKQPDLVISRVPQNTLTWFKKECSKEEYCNDWGMMLRELVEGYKRLKMYENQHLPTNPEVMEYIANLKKEIDDLREQVKSKGQPEQKIRRTLSGRVIGGLVPAELHIEKEGEPNGKIND